LQQQTLDRQLPLALLPPEAAALPFDPFPDTLLVEEKIVSATPILSEPNTPIAGPTFDASTLPEKQREQFYRNLRALERCPSFFRYEGNGRGAKTFVSCDNSSHVQWHGYFLDCNCPCHWIWSHP